jgi:Flp pilus assembly protein TadB
MSDDSRTRRQRSVDWQNRYITPILVGLAFVVIAAVWALGGIPAWMAILLLVFAGASFVMAIRRNRS